MASLLIGKKLLINNREYIILDPNNNKENCISLYNGSSKRYLRHYASKLVETQSSLNASKYSYDSSFIPEIKDNKLFLKVSNPGFINRYVYKDGDIYKITPKDSNPDDLKYGFTISDTDVNTDVGINNVLYTDLKEKYIELEKKFAYEVASAKLRYISGTIKKKKRVVFIGTGKLGENAQYAFIHLNKLIKKEKISDIELLYFARNKIEKEYFESLGLSCEIWSSKNPYHVQYALQAKVAVFSTHTFDNGESNSTLLSCISGAYRIQLWHGFMAKMVGCATLKDGCAIGRTANMLEDCAVNVVTTALSSKNVIEKYEICFPGADVICTGDARTDALFQTTKNDLVDKWCKSNQNKYKLLFSPTYRESAASALAYIESFTELCSGIDKEQVAIAIKFHPIFFSKLAKERDNIIKQVENIGVLFISERDDSYTIMNKFDALVTDYSSIRIDFALTEKPIFLFQPDFSKYTSARIINPMKEFNMLDSVSYDVDKDDIIEALKNDNKRSERLEIIKNMGLYTDGKSSERVCSIIITNI